MKVYTKVTSGMEMTMARGRFLGAAVERVSISPGGWGRGPGDPAREQSESLSPGSGSVGGLGTGKGAALLSPCRPPAPPWATSNPEEQV